MGIGYNTNNWQLGSYLADRFSVMKKVESVKLAAYFKGRVSLSAATISMA